MKMESHIHLKLVDAVTKYFEKMLSHRQMMTLQKWLRHHLTQHFLKIFGHSINQLNRILPKCNDRNKNKNDLFHSEN